MNIDNFQWTDDLVKEFVYDFLENKKVVGESNIERFKKEKLNEKKDYEIISTRIIENSTASSEITSVRRKSDGEVFSIGDNVEHYLGNTHKITRFGIVKSNLRVYHDDEGKDWYSFLRNIKKLSKPIPLFLTEDSNIPVYKGDKFYYVSDDLDKVEEHIANTSIVPFGKAFFVPDAAKEYILLNKKVLSLQDLLNNWSGIGKGSDDYKSAPMFQIFKEVAKQKMKL